MCGVLVQGKLITEEEGDENSPEYWQTWSGMRRTICLSLA